MEDDNALVSQQCELSNGTKALFPDEFVNNYYSIYTEMRQYNAPCPLDPAEQWFSNIAVSTEVMFKNLQFT